MAKGEEREIRVILERLSRLMRAEDHNSSLNPAQWESLRYLARANRFSNSPSALTQYLGATKGTVSQTLSALERKKLIKKSVRVDDPRSLELTLTAAGRKILDTDSWNRLETEAGTLAPKNRTRMLKGLRSLLQAELANSHATIFGECRKCRYFRAKGWPQKNDGPHKCLLLEAPLSKNDSKKICAKFDPV